MKSWKKIVLLGMMVVLSGCVSVVPPATPNVKFRYLPWEKRQARVKSQKFFIAKGAFSLAEQGKKPVFANYNWIQNNKNFYRIRVSSALNLFNVIILGRVHSVTLWKSSNQHITAKTPEGLIKREMGWTLPVRNLFYWLRGVIAPGKRQLTYDKYGHVVTLKQDGWNIRFSSFTTVKGYDLPEKVVLLRPGMRVTIVIKRWTLSNKSIPLQ
ncbi:MAG: outer membrane lipoprotein LolB [Coxiellaceae bacterium]|nr:outer membrane lipoprotein LolB [Coxiellaceae bacterium]